MAVLLPLVLSGLLLGWGCAVSDTNDEPTIRIVKGTPNRPLRELLEIAKRERPMPDAVSPDDAKLIWEFRRQILSR